MKPHRTAFALSALGVGFAARDRARNPVKSDGLVRSGDQRSTEKIYGFVKAYQADYPITTMCRVLEVSTSGYYAWSKREPSARTVANQQLGDRIEALHRQSRSTYGRPRIQADLRDAGICLSDKRVARLMRERSLHGACRRKAFKTTVRDTLRPISNLILSAKAGQLHTSIWANRDLGTNRAIYVV
jgi:hypothetical protein